MNSPKHFDVIVIGSGIAGIASAYYLLRGNNKNRVLLVDREPPMSYTSAQSGDNYRNWWPHPVMTAFTNRSIDLLEALARESGDAFRMRRRGYALATRSNDIEGLLADLDRGYAEAPDDEVRVHDSAARYELPASDDWESAPRGVDILAGQQLIQDAFPALSPDVRYILHIRRAGDISGQQLGQWMLEAIGDAGGRRRSAEVSGIEPAGHGFSVSLRSGDETEEVRADRIVNAAGPFAGEIAAMLGTELPVTNIYQQKIAFEDHLGVVPRDLPFAIDLDDVHFDWSEEEREFLREDPATAWLTEPQRGGAHCRPEGGRDGKWIKLGWAFNREPSKPLTDLASEPTRHPQYPEIAMRAAARLQPALAAYLDDFPTRYSHYGGYYTMTKENWPLIGPLDNVPGAYIVGALSGYGSMASCAAGQLIANWIEDRDLPSFGPALSFARYSDSALMGELNAASSRGIL